MIELAIFIVTYALIAMQNLTSRIDRPAASTIGAASMLAFGVLSLDEAVRAIDHNTIILLFGMMVLTAYLGISGFFDYLAKRIMEFSGNGKRLLFTITISSGFLSALFVNDTICVFMTPVVVRIALASGLNPVPLLIALATSANAGSVATIIGNPQNMLIAIKSGINFVEFARIMLPVSLLALLIIYAVIHLVYGKELRNFRPAEVEVEVDRRLAVKSLLVFVFVLGLFISGVYPIALSALIGAAVMFAVGGISPKFALERVDWGLLLLFCNLFIVMRAVEGYAENLLSGLNADGSLASTITFSLFTVAGSNLVSNVPFVMMALPTISSRELYYVLAMASTFAGNLTIIGSVANLIVAEVAERHGVKLGFLEYMRVGVPVTFLSIFAGILVLQVVL
ncbi:MAG: anion transporter [Archaeoglobi archaeon]|nr:anion transporter [Candidatus Mnemosynella sp.]